jgi:hypothetical protein
MARRTADDWARLLRELDRSDLSAEQFARARGIRPDTLKWWRWRLGHSAKGGAKRRGSASVKLLAVKPVAESAPRDHRDFAAPVWELVAPSGYELRVYDRSGLAVLKAALFAVAGGRRR